MIRTVTHSDGYVAHYAVCHECKRESDRPLIEGVQYKDDALNVALPHGWTQVLTWSGRGINRVALDYCPRCSVAPEYRK